MPENNRAILSYWNGSAWVDVTVAGANDTTTSALIGYHLADRLGASRRVRLTISNQSSDPFANAAGSKGPFSGTFTDFMPIRLRDGTSQDIIYAGSIYEVSEEYDNQYGMLIKINCRDAVSELRDNTVKGALNYKIDTSQDKHVSVLNTDSRDLDKKQWGQGISTRSGLIKSIVTHFSKNIEVPADIVANDSRFVDSVQKFHKNKEVYTVSGKNSSSPLSHITKLAAADAHFDAITDGSLEQKYTYDFYTDPNFTSTASDHKPQAYFNYFKRGSRPTTTPQGSATGGGLRVEYASDDTTGTGSGEWNTSLSGVDFAGRLEPMFEFEFRRPKGEIQTDAALSYVEHIPEVDEDTGEETGEIDEIITREITVEIIKIKASANPTNFKWQNRKITGPQGSEGKDEGSAEWLTVSISGSPQRIARIQYLNKTSSISATSPAFMLVSHVVPLPTGGNASTNYWAENTVMTGETSGATVTIQTRMSDAYNVRRTMTVSAMDTDDPRTIRENLAAGLIRSSTQMVRGNFKTYGKPRYYFDDIVASVSGTSTQVIDLSGSINPNNFGFHKGMTVVQLDNDGNVPEDDPIYGYASTVTSSAVTVTWGGGLAGGTGAIAAGAKLRYFVPVRAGDLIYVRCDLVGIGGVYSEGDNAGKPRGLNMMVTDLEYTEEPGVSHTMWDVVGSEDDETMFAYPVKTNDAAAADRVQSRENMPPKLPPTVQGNSTWRTYALDPYTVHWTGGRLLHEGEAHNISASDTTATMVSAANGNTGQPTSDDPYDVNNSLYPNAYLMYASVKAADLAGTMSNVTDPTTVSVTQTTEFKLGQIVTVGSEKLKIMNINKSANTIKVVRGYAGSTTAAHSSGDDVMYNTPVRYTVYWPGSGSALKTIRKTNYKNMDEVIEHNAIQLFDVEWHPFEAKWKFTFPNINDNKTAHEVGNTWAPSSIDSYLLKKGAQAWTTDLVFSGTDWDTIKWHRKGASDSTGGVVSFGDEDIENVNANTGFQFTSNYYGKTAYIYKNVGEAANNTLAATLYHNEVYRDDRVLLAMVIVAASDDDTDSPSIFPFNGNEGTISAGIIAAQAIVGGMVKANQIETGHISGTLAGNKLSIDANTTFAANWRAGDSTGEASHTFLQDGPNPPTGSGASVQAGDLWLDTRATEFKLYKAGADGSNEITSGEWELVNDTTMFGTGPTVFRNPRGTIPAHDNANSNTPAVNSKQFDIWTTSDTNQIFIATNATQNDAVASGKWILKDDADAINNATTTINGGLINTQRIKLLKGGGSGSATQSNTQYDETGSKRTAVDTSREVNMPVYNTGTATQSLYTVTGSGTNWTQAYVGLAFTFSSGGGGGTIDKVLSSTSLTVNTSATVGSGTYTIVAGTSGSGSHLIIDPFQTNDLRIYSGDVIKIDNEDMYVEGGTDTTLVVKRAWNGTAAAIHADNAAIFKYLEVAPYIAGSSVPTTADRELLHVAGLTNPHIIMDHRGITGYSNEWTQQFSLDSETGKGVFGAGAAQAAADGLTIASIGTPTPGAAGSNTPGAADINTLNFGWHETDLAVARGSKYVQLGGYSLASSGSNLDSDIFSVVWYQNASTYLQMHDFNRGSIGNLTGISSGGIYATESGVGHTQAGSRQYWRPPANVHSGTDPTAVADNVPAAGAARSESTDGRSANLKPLLRLKKDSDSTGRGDRPWGTEWALYSDFSDDLHNAVTSGYVPTSKFGIFRYANDGAGATEDTLAFASNQTNATPAAGTDRSAFWIMKSQTNQLILEPSVGWNVSGANQAWIGLNNQLMGVNTYYSYIGAGTAAAPGLRFVSDQDTGIFMSAFAHINFSIGGTDSYVMDAGGFLPSVDSAKTLGSTSYRWTEVHADNGTIQTSDLRLKTQIQPIALGLDFVNSLNPVSYKWKDKIDQSTHQGLLAQEVFNTLEGVDIQSRDEFGALDGDEDTNYGLNYAEFVPILIKAVQELTEKVKELEGGK